MREVEVGLRVVDGVETLKFVSNTFDVETALVPGIEDAKYASLPNRVAKIASSPSWWIGVTGLRTGRPTQFGLCALRLFQCFHWSVIFK